MKEMKKYGCVLSAAAAMLMISGNSFASSCTTSLLTSYANTVDSYGYNSATTTSATIGVCGYSITASASVPIDTFDNSNSGTFTLAGKEVYLETNAATFDDATSANTLLVKVDGVEKFNGVIGNATLAEMLSLANLLTFNGKTVTVTTDISGLTYANLDTATDSTYDNNTITVSVDGVVVYSGLIGNLTTQDGANFLAALGSVDAGTIVQQDVQRTATTVTTTIVANRISSVLKSAKFGRAPIKKDSGIGDQSGLGITGISSGDEMQNKGVWFSGGNTWLRSTDTFAPYKGTLQTALIGVDGQPQENFLVGVTVGLENTNLDTSFNSGELEIFGATFTPYVGYRFLDGAVTWGAQAGYGIFWNDSERTSNGVDITGSYKSQRLMLNTDVDYYKNLGDSNWTFNGTVGTLLVWDSRDDYSESDGTTPTKNDTVLGEAKLGATLFYTVNDKLQAYVGATYLYDYFMDQDFDVANNEDKDQVDVNIGFDFVNEKDHTITIDASGSFGREDTDVYTVQANYRMPF
ncbi:MAG: autotransporter domain-containing protein [Magnetococcales bacterium]|nr:autotransporter domain-containing protein [Magnetococcales bacterium]